MPRCETQASAGAVGFYEHLSRWGVGGSRDAARSAVVTPETTEGGKSAETLIGYP
jgi:hypothetical protein